MYTLKEFMQLNNRLSFVLTLFIVLPLYSIDQAPRYKGTKNLEKSFAKVQKDRERKRQINRYYKTQAHELFDEEFGEYERKAATKLRHRKNKNNNKK